MIPYNTDAPLYHLPIATVALIAVNTLLFLVVPSSFVSPIGGGFNFTEAIGDLDPEQFDPQQLLALAALESENLYPSNTLILEYGQGLKPWQWFTSIFMHSDFLHLLLNMISLWAFGLVVEGKVGPFVFLGLYLGIGAGESAVEQAMMSFAAPGGSLGASAAIFGILGLAIVWAPRNDFDVFWSFGFRAGSIEIPILVYGFFALAMEIVAIALGRFGYSSGILHLMGLALGIGLGFLWLRRRWVDCEGWDLITVLKGNEGNYAENQQLDHEARDLVRSSLKGRLETTSDSARQTAPSQPFAGRPMQSPAPEEFDDLLSRLPQAAPIRGPLHKLEQLIVAGDSAAALKLWLQFKQAPGSAELSKMHLGKLIRDLLSAKEFAAAVPLMSESIRRFPENSRTLQLDLAKVLLHLERPHKAAVVLRGMQAEALDPTARAAWQKLAAHARKQIDEGVIELSD